MKLTLRRKLGLSFALLILITISVLGVSSYQKARAIVLDEMRFNNEQALSNVNDYYLHNFMAGMTYAVNTWAEQPAIVNYQNSPGQKKMVTEIPESFKPVSDAWKGYLSGNPDIAWIYLGVEEDGSILLAPLDPTMPADYDCRTRDWYKETIGQYKNAYWTQPYLDAGDSGEVIVTVSRAVWNNEKLVGVIGMDIKLRKFSELIRGINANGEGYLMLMGANGDIYAHPDDKMLTQNLSDQHWVKNILTNNKGTNFFDESGQKYIYSYLTVPETGWKLVGVRPVNLPAAIGEIRTWTLDAAILAGVFILIAGVFMTQVFLKPLNTIMSVITRVSEGDMDIRMHMESNDEFGILSAAFNRMLNRISTLVQERDSHVDALIEKNKEVISKNQQITELYEETETMNEELTTLLGEVRGGYLTTVRALANAIEASDYYTRGHCDRVRHYALKLGEALEFNEQEQCNLEFASMLHDVGKIGIPHSILNKPDRLTAEEFDEIKKHPAIGSEIISGIPFLDECRIILRQHHERVDGKGYPDGCAGGDIHYSAKILAIVDAYDAMTSARPYRSEPMPVEQAMAELQSGSGTQFDANLVRLFVRIVENERQEQGVQSTIFTE